MSATPDKIKELLKTMTAEQKAQNLATVTYIKTVANSSNTDISSWPILKIFAQEDGFNLIADKKLINKRFFEYLQAFKEANKDNETKEAELNTAELTGAFKAAAKRVRDDMLLQKNNDLNARKRDMDSTYANYLEYQKHYLKVAEEVRVLRSSEDAEGTYNKVVDGIRKVIADGLWTNPVFKDGFLYLNTKASVILKEINKQANLDINLDFGHFAVKIDTQRQFYLKVIPYKNNLDSGNGYYHPHIQPGGDICWGEAGSMMTRHLADMNIGDVLRLLHALLNSYNSGSPYQTLATFKNTNRKLNFTNLSSTIKHPDLLKPPKQPKVEDVTAGAVAPLAAGVVTQPSATTVDIQF